jgi:putative oxidoreductase
MLREFLKPIPLTDRLSLAVFILRVGFAFFLATHGYGKLQSFLAGDHDFPDPFHVSPILSQGLTIFAEFFCSILIILGFFTRIAVIILIICMMVVAFIIHGPDPIGDKEHAILYVISFIVIFLTGPGKYSLDARLYK